MCVSAHKVLNEKVQKRVNKGEDCVLVGDINAGINPESNKVIQAAKNILAWEESGEVRILNNKNEPTHVPFISEQ